MSWIYFPIFVTSQYCVYWYIVPIFGSSISVICITSSSHVSSYVSALASLFYSALFLRSVCKYNSLVYYTILCAYLVSYLVLTQSFYNLSNKIQTTLFLHSLFLGLQPIYKVSQTFQRTHK